MRRNIAWRKVRKRALVLALAAVLAVGTGLGASAMDVRAEEETVIFEENSLLPEEEETAPQVLTEEPSEVPDFAGEELIEDSVELTDLSVSEEETAPQTLTEEEVTLTEELSEVPGAAGEDLIEDSVELTDLSVSEEETTPQVLPEEEVTLPEEEEVLAEEPSGEAAEVTELTDAGEETACAASVDPAFVRGTASVLGQAADYNQKTGTQIVRYGGRNWYVIGYNGQGVAGQPGAMTLISVENIGDMTVFNSDSNNNYSGSILQGKVNAVANAFTAPEKAAVVPRTLSSGVYAEQNTDCVAGPQVNNALLWPLSTKEAYAMQEALRKASNGWWLRSPYRIVDYAAYVHYDGSVFDGGNVYIDFGVRPAFYLNLDSVLFTSAATGGKSSNGTGAGALKAVGTNAGDEWKLTIADASRNGFSAKKERVDGTTLTISYSGAMTGPGEYLSVIIENAAGQITHYGNIKRLESSSHASGTATVNLENRLDFNDKVFVFNEKLNGTHVADVASKPVEIKDVTSDIYVGERVGLVWPSHLIVAEPHPVGVCFSEVHPDSSSDIEIADEFCAEDDGTLSTKLPAWDTFRNGKSYVYGVKIAPKDGKRFRIMEGRLKNNIFVAYREKSEDHFQIKSSNFISTEEFNRKYAETGNYNFLNLDEGALEYDPDGKYLWVYRRYVAGSIPVTGVSMSEPTLSLEAGKSHQLMPFQMPANAANKEFTWTSSNSAVATVSENGLVTAIKAGNAVITVTTKEGGFTATCNVTVTEGSGGGTGGSTGGGGTGGGTGGGGTKTPDELTKEFITRAYREILGRTPDTSGMNYWFGELKAKRLGGGQMCAQFLNSREFINKKYNSGKTMDIMYRVYMNRTPEANGKKFWMDYLDNGLSVIYVAKGFTASAEFKNICKSYGIDPGTVALTQNRDKNEKVTRFVSRCYKESLGRNGEESGLNYWTGELLAKKITPAKVAEQFVFSKEMNSKGYDNSRFIQMLYRLCMGRTYDQGGLNYWLGEMGKGMTRQQVFTHFVNSREFQNIVKSYGL